MLPTTTLGRRVGGNRLLHACMHLSFAQWVREWGKTQFCLSALACLLSFQESNTLTKFCRIELNSVFAPLWSGRRVWRHRFLFAYIPLFTRDDDDDNRKAIKEISTQTKHLFHKFPPFVVDEEQASMNRQFAYLFSTFRREIADFSDYTHDLLTWLKLCILFGDALKKQDRSMQYLHITSTIRTMTVVTFSHLMTYIFACFFQMYSLLPLGSLDNCFLLFSHSCRSQTSREQQTPTAVSAVVCGS